MAESGMCVINTKEKMQLLTVTRSSVMTVGVSG